MTSLEGGPSSRMDDVMGYDALAPRGWHCWSVRQVPHACTGGTCVSGAHTSVDAAAVALARVLAGSGRSGGGSSSGGTPYSGSAVGSDALSLGRVDGAAACMTAELVALRAQHEALRAKYREQSDRQLTLRAALLDMSGARHACTEREREACALCLSCDGPTPSIPYGDREGLQKLRDSLEGCGCTERDRQASRQPRFDSI